MPKKTRKKKKGKKTKKRKPVKKKRKVLRRSKKRKALKSKKRKTQSSVSKKIDDNESPIKAAKTQNVVWAFEALILLIPKLI